MPLMKPSTTWRARSSSREMRAIVSGCRKRRGSSLTATDVLYLRCENLAEALVARQLAFAARRLLQNALDDGIGRDAFRRGGEVRQDAGPQDRIRERLDVFGLHVGAAVEQGAGLAAEGEGLPGPRGGAPRQPVAGEL